jgi:hypothetical protein
MPQFASVLLFPLRERWSSENAAVTALCSDIDPLTCYLMLHLMKSVNFLYTAYCDDIELSGAMDA